MTIREIRQSDRDQWLRMRDALWPGAFADHDDETRRFFEERQGAAVVFVADADGALIGFLELDFRKYAPGCQSSPVPFIEGWYVDLAHRGRGVGRSLIAAAEECARQAGYGEIASDVELDNADGAAAHRAVGFEEIERVICFRRSLTGQRRG